MAALTPEPPPPRVASPAVLRRSDSGTALAPCLDVGDGALVISEQTWRQLNAELRFDTASPQPAGDLVVPASVPRQPHVPQAPGTTPPQKRVQGRSPLKGSFVGVSQLFSAAERNAKASGGVSGPFEWCGLFALDRAVRIKDRITRLQLPFAPGPRELILAKYDPKAPAETDGSWDEEMKRFLAAKDRYYGGLERDLVEEHVAAGKDRSMVERLQRKVEREQRLEKDRREREEEERRQRLAGARQAQADRRRKRREREEALAELERQTESRFQRVAQEGDKWRQEKVDMEIKTAVQVDLRHLDARTGLPLGSEEYERHRRMSEELHDEEHYIASSRAERAEAAARDVATDKSVVTKYSQWMRKLDTLAAPRRRVVHGGVLVTGAGMGSALVEYTMPEGACG